MYCTHVHVHVHLQNVIIPTFNWNVKNKIIDITDLVNLVFQFFVRVFLAGSSQGPSQAGCGANAGLSGRTR